MEIEVSEPLKRRVGVLGLVQIERTVDAVPDDLEP